MLRADGKVERERTQTTLPDIDIECFGEFSGVPNLDERVDCYLNSHSQCYDSLEQLWSMDFLDGRRVILSFGFGIVEAAGSPGELVIARNALKLTWNRLDEHRQLVDETLENWVPRQVQGWPRKLQSNSPLDRVGQITYDNFRELLDHLYLDLCAAVASEVNPNPCDGAQLDGQLFFLRKSRYYKSTDTGKRQRVMRKISLNHELKEANSDFLLGYFLSWGDMSSLKKLLKDKNFRDALVSELRKQADKQDSSEEDAIITRIDSVIRRIEKPRSPKERNQEVIQVIETPLGEHNGENYCELVRSVFDSAFTSGTPEIVWEVRSDPRYSEGFKKTAPLELQACENALWPSQASEQDAYVFIPFTFGADIILGAYLVVPMLPPFVGETPSLCRLSTLTKQVIQTNRTYMHWMMASYPRAVIQVFKDGFSLILAGMDSEEIAENKQKYLEQYINKINEGCKAVHLLYGFPEVHFSHGAAGEKWHSLWSCYQTVLADVRTLVKREPWCEDHAHQYFLHEIGFHLVGFQKNKLQVTLDNLISSLLGLYVMHDLGMALDANLEKERVTGMTMRSDLSHEIGGLIDVMPRALREEPPNKPLLDWCMKVMKQVLSGFQHMPASVTDIQEQIEYIESVMPIHGAIVPSSGDRRVYGEVFVLPRDDTPLCSRLSEGAFYQIFRNMWKNAEQVLAVLSASEEPSEDSRLYGRIRSALEAYEPFSKRFSKQDRPELRRLGLIRRHENMIVIEVLDNAPQLIPNHELHYPEQSPRSHLGIRTIQQIVENSHKSGTEAYYEAPHSLATLRPEGLDELLRLVAADDRLKSFSLAETHNWTRTALYIEEIVDE
ncbi:MAG: hypothetical protein ABW139_06675 [Candidatus Thiodiazotropha sp. DIVDIV]